MPSVNQEIPDAVRPYTFHGVDLQWEPRDKNALADCPWCGKERKFSVTLSTGLWKCWSCGEGTERGGGNVRTFLELLWRKSLQSTTDEQYQELADDRGLLHIDTLMQWGVAMSILTNSWIVPGHSPSETLELSGLYMYLKRGSKKILMGTPTQVHSLFGIVPLIPKKIENVYICEGPWDAMVLWETLAHSKLSGNAILPTSNREVSFLANSVVVAVPGCSTFKDAWMPLLGNKTVNFLYDNDHERSGAPPAGPGHQLRVAKLLRKAKIVPKEINLCRWGSENGFNTDLPNGTDVRDFIGQGPIIDRLRKMQGLFEYLSPLGQILGETTHDPETVRITKEGMECLPCTDYRTLSQAWRKAMRWTKGLDCALSVMLSAVTSTKVVGDQLWVKIIGPASCGKSTLCEAISTNTQYVAAKSVIRGFHTGWKNGKDDEDDHSLITEIRDKTLVIKDGDTLLQSPNLPQILSEARDIYDGTSRASYRNAETREYTGIRVSWLLCGTDSLRQIDSSELGERFIDCVVMDNEIDDDLEDEIGWRVACRTDKNMGVESNGKAETNYEPELATAMQLTGGYVSYLRENAMQLLASFEFPRKELKRVQRLAKFISYMRARPSKIQIEDSGREFSARLTSQLVRLAKCVAIVLNKTTVDEEVMARTHKVALDTSRGMSLDIVEHLIENEEGSDTTALVNTLRIDRNHVSPLLMFLRKLGVVDFCKFEVEGAKTSQNRWVLTARMQKLYAEIQA